MPTADKPAPPERFPPECLDLLRELLATMKKGNVERCLDLQAMANARLREQGYKVHDFPAEFFELKHRFQLRSDGLLKLDDDEVWDMIHRQERILRQAEVDIDYRYCRPEHELAEARAFQAELARLRKLGDVVGQYRLVEASEEKIRQSGKGHRCHPRGYWDMHIEAYQAQEAGDMVKHAALQTEIAEMDEEDEIREAFFIGD